MSFPYPHFGAVSPARSCPHSCPPCRAPAYCLAPFPLISLCASLGKGVHGGSTLHAAPGGGNRVGIGGGTCRFGQNHEMGSSMGSPQLLGHSMQRVRAPAVGVYGNLSQPWYFFMWKRDSGRHTPLDRLLNSLICLSFAAVMPLIVKSHQGLGDEQP